MPYLTVPYVFFLLSPGPFVFPVETDPHVPAEKTAGTPCGLSPKEPSVFAQGRPLFRPIYGDGETTASGAPSPSQVRLLPPVCPPLTSGHFHIGKGCPERGIFRGTGIYPKRNLSVPFVHMADPHLPKLHPVVGTFDTIIVFPPAKTVPHGFYRSGDPCGCPVRISVVCHHAS